MLFASVFCARTITGGVSATVIYSYIYIAECLVDVLWSGWRLKKPLALYDIEHGFVILFQTL
jgi:hypothetical protein